MTEPGVALASPYRRAVPVWLGLQFCYVTSLCECKPYVSLQGVENVWGRLPAINPNKVRTHERMRGEFKRTFFVLILV